MASIHHLPIRAVSIAARHGADPVGNRGARHDPRWHPLCAELARLRERGRCAIRIVDVDCGVGTFLLQALHQARAFGFGAIEGRGIDGSPALIGRARAAAARAPDPAIGVVFEVGDLLACLDEEEELPADVLVWHGSRDRDLRPTAARLGRAAQVVIGDAGPQAADRP